MRNRAKSTLQCVSIAVALAALAPIVGAADAPGMGTWKLNPEKSTFSPGPGPKAIKTTFTPEGDAVRWSSERTLPDGKMAVARYTAKYDGKDYPITGSPTADTVTLQRVDARTTIRLNKKDGKLVSTERRQVAEDGRSYVTTVTGTTPDGKPVSHRMVFDRQ